MSVAPSTRWLSPPAIAEQLGIDTAKILTWIKTGELRATNVATSTSGRARWRVAPTDLDDFLRRRQCVPAVKPTRRKRRAERGVIQFF